MGRGNRRRYVGADIQRCVAKNNPGKKHINSRLSIHIHHVAGAVVPEASHSEFFIQRLIVRVIMSYENIHSVILGTHGFIPVLIHCGGIKSHGSRWITV